MAGLNLGFPSAGVVLFEDYLRPMGVSQAWLAGRIGYSPRWMREVFAGKRPITPIMDSELAIVLETPTGFWLSLDNSLTKYRPTRTAPQEPSVPREQIKRAVEKTNHVGTL